MPRKARVDVAGQYYHVISRGIERREIFSQNEDYEDFLERFRVWLENCGAKCMAWCLMPNHFHFLLLRGERPLSELMHHLMTGYAVNYNLRRNRCGHLFQNRYKSILCSCEEYFLEAVPYIHLNPLKAGLAKDLNDLMNYPWCGHRALVAGDADGILCVPALLEHYGGGEPALPRYVAAMEVKAAELERERAEARRRVSRFSGETKDFVGDILKKVERLEERPFRPRAELLAEASRLTGVACGDILHPSRIRAAAKARAVYCYLCREQAGVSGQELMEELEIKQSGISKLIAKGRALLAGNN
ncbi:MAG: transposase [Elusimicrobia bacterium]|nr:transposase [Elusimicrobiota bacterium]